MKPLLERISVLEGELATALATLAAIKSAAGFALASDESTRERLEGFLSVIAGIDNRQATTLLDVLQRDMDNAIQQQTLAALRSRLDFSGTATGRHVSTSEEGPSYERGGVVGREGAEAAARIARAYNMSTSQAARAFYDAGGALNNFGPAELRALDQALHPTYTRADFEDVTIRRATAALERTTEEDDMIENVSDNDDMPDLDD